MPGGTLYYPEDTVIAETLVTAANTSGVNTTTIATTFMNQPNRVLCAYAETYFRVGTVVYITASAPSCCCPKLYSSTTQLGGFYCPFGVTGTGPFATVPTSVSDIITVDAALDVYPYCHDTVVTSTVDR
jgi:hypothetical protein